MSSKKELKPCPFCGGEAKHVQYQIAEDEVHDHIECKGCEATGGYSETCMGNTQGVAHHWNERSQLK